MFWKKSPEQQVEDKIIKAFRGHRGTVTYEGREFSLERPGYLSMTQGFDITFLDERMDINRFCWICDNLDKIIETIEMAVHEFEVKKQKEKERRQECLDKCLEKLK